MSLVHHAGPVDSRSRPNRPDSHLKALDPASAAVKKALRDRAVLMINAEADRLLDEHPDCQLSLVELRDFIARLAMRRRVPMQFG